MRARNVKEAAVLASARQNGAALSDKDKWAIIHMMEAGHTQSAVAQQLNINRNVVSKYWQRYNSTGGVARQPGSGRKPIIGTAAEDKALELVTGSDSLSAEDAGKQLHAEGVLPHAVHRTTIIRAAHKAARRTREKLWVQRGKPPKAMTVATKQKRLAFALANLHTDWGKVLFTDRKKFHLRYPGTKVKTSRWVRGPARAAKAVAFQPTKPSCYNTYAGLCLFGTTVAHPVAGTTKHTEKHTNKKGEPARNITESEYKVVVEKTLLPEGRRLFTTQGISTWTLQMDNDPSHNCAAGVVKKYNKANGSSVQQLGKWPPNSPDLNPIENMWAWLQRRVDQMGCSSFEEFKRAVDSELAAVPKEHLVNLVGSMKKRIELVVQNEGGPTGY
jgi:DNA-binding CsgD family transcriptional regulator